MLSSMEEIAGDIDAEEESTEGSKCPYCRTVYTSRHPKNCEHILCELFYAESNNELMASPNCPIVATLFGIEVPRVVAMRFLRSLRERHRSELDPGDPITTIKCSSETADSFMEWTYFLARHPQKYVRLFEAFVCKTYCDNALPRTVVPFSQLRVCNNIVSLSLEFSLSTLSERWVVLTGLPDSLPIFLFPVETEEGVAHINSSGSVLRRISEWRVQPDTCVVNPLVTLPSYLLN